MKLKVDETYLSYANIKEEKKDKADVDIVKSDHIPLLRSQVTTHFNWYVKSPINTFDKNNN